MSSKGNIEGVQTVSGIVLIDYNHLKNKPESDVTLTTSGGFADGLVTGVKFNDVNKKIENILTQLETLKSITEDIAEIKNNISAIGVKYDTLSAELTSLKDKVDSLTPSA